MRLSFFLWTTLLLAACGGSGSGPGTPTPTATPKREANVFGSFNFTIASASAADQAHRLAGFGYAGVMLPYDSRRLAEFAALPEVAAGRFRVIAVLIGVEATRALDAESLARAFDETARAGAIACLHVHWATNRPVDPDRMVAVVQEAADIAATVNGGKGTTVVLYPHAGEPMDSTEAAQTVRMAAARPNVKLSLHLCHELKAGHHGRLPSVIAQVAPDLALVTINGADYAQDTGQGNWFHFIRPLAAGDFDVENLYLRPLLDAGYQGPVVLHTFELREPPEEHFPQSMARWREMMDAYGLLTASR